MSERNHMKIIILGGGSSGPGMAIRLRRQGLGDFVIPKRAADSFGPRPYGAQVWSSP